MNIFSESDLKKDLSSGLPGFVYLIFGEDDYLKKFYVSKMIKSIVPNDDTFNLQRFSDEAVMSSVSDAVWQYPLMAERKCVVLTDYNFEDCDKSEFEKLLNLCKDPCDTTVFIIYLNRVLPDRKNERTKKLISAIEACGKAICLDHRSRPELIKMLCDGAIRRNSRISSGVAGYLIEVCGNDINILKSEIEKLSAYCSGRDITKADIDTVCIRTIETSVFYISRAITSAKPAEALRILDELMYNRVEPMLIISTLSGAYVDMMRACAARNAGIKNQQVSADFGYKKNREFLLTRAGENLRRFDENKLNLSFKALNQADLALKTTGVDARVVLEKLITELTCIAIRGKVSK